MSTATAKFAVFYLDTTGVAQMEPEWPCLDAALRFLDFLRVHRLIDGSPAIEAYTGDCPW